MKALVFGVKVAVTAAFVWFLIHYVDFKPIGAFLKSGRGAATLGLCVVILLVQAVLGAMRLRLIMRLLGTECAVSTAFSIWMIGLLMGQALVTFVAGDAVRVWELVKRHYKTRLAASAIFLDRLIGFVVLIAMVVFCIPVLLARAQDGAVHHGIVVLGALCAFGMVGFMASVFLGNIIRRVAPRLSEKRIAAAVIDVASATRHLMNSWKLSAGIAGVSAIMHLLNVLVFFIFLHVAGVAIEPLANMAVSLPVMLIALMPIALAGWGIREGSAVVGYGLFGVSASAAVTASVGFGVALLLTSLPGIFFFWLSKSRLPPPLQLETEGGAT